MDWRGLGPGSPRTPRPFTGPKAAVFATSSLCLDAGRARVRPGLHPGEAGDLPRAARLEPRRLGEGVLPGGEGFPVPLPSPESGSLTAGGLKGEHWGDSGGPRERRLGSR